MINVETMTKSTPEEALGKLIQTVHKLRAPDGCPWDREQTHQTLRPYLIEEAYEVLDVLDRIESPKDLLDETIRAAFREELGDLLMQVLLHSEMASEEKAFHIGDVAHALNEKLIRRHPHVFGDVKVADADSAYQSWEKQKAKEKVSKPNASILDGVPKGLPALQRAARFIEKVTKVGFQWNDLNGPMDKLDEEMAELKTEIHTLETMRGGVATAEGAEADQVRRRIENELGDLLFSICNVAFLTKTLPEDALRGTLARFESRFKHIERRLKEIGKNSEDSNLEEMDQFWNEAKKLEKS